MDRKGSNLLLAVLLMIATVGLVIGSKVRYDGHEVRRIVPADSKQLGALKILKDHAFEMGLDFWTDPTSTYHPVDIHIGTAHHSQVMSILRDQNLTSETLIPDLQAHIEYEMRTNVADVEENAGFHYSIYHELSEIYAWTYDMASKYSQIASVHNITTSYEGRTLTALKISTARGLERNRKPVFWMHSAIHAREWIGPATIMYMTAKLLELYNRDPEVTDILDHYEWYILPVFNVDGYQYTWTTDRLWRKTRSLRPGCDGVDPNRNWAYKWGGGGGGIDPCALDYRGPEPFSEIETRNVAKFLSGLKERLTVFLGIHSYQQVWMTPWGYTTETPYHYKDQLRAAEVGAEALKKVYGTEYKCGNIGTLMYLSSGCSVDWAYGELGTKYSQTIELRDTGDYGFLLPAYNIIPSGRETYRGLVAFAQFIINNR